MISMGSTLVTFEDIAELNRVARDRSHMKWPLHARCMIRYNMFTFGQITQIEAKRREIEGLQSSLNDYKNAARFGAASSAGDMFRVLPDDITPILREALCKGTVAKILKLLDECAHLGVDTEPSKKALMEVLEKLKVPS